MTEEKLNDEKNFINETLKKLETLKDGMNDDKVYFKIEFDVPTDVFSAMVQTLFNMVTPKDNENMQKLFAALLSLSLQKDEADKEDEVKQNPL